MNHLLCCFHRTVLLLALIFCAPKFAFAQATNSNTATNLTALKVEMEQAMNKVRAIVNQPVQGYVRTSKMRVSTFSPGWFHEGALKPDFNNVDVRTTQEFIYDQSDYVTSDLNPRVVYIGRQLEFNAMTKYFYTDRTVPKKKLTQAEMVEINRLYRIIGRCEKEIAALENPQPTNEEGAVANLASDSEVQYVRQPVPKANYIKAAIGVALVLAMYGVYRIFRRSASS